MKNYTGWICTKCKCTSCSKSCEGLRCNKCLSTNVVYLRDGKRLSKQEEIDACLVRVGLKTANPFARYGK